MNTGRKQSNASATSAVTPQPSFLFADECSMHQRTSSYPNGISFSVDGSQHKDLAYIEKRSAHNALERQRREGLNTKYQELAHTLPTLHDVKRPSKNMIVTKSLEYVSNAHQRQTEYQNELATLKKENAQLQRQAQLMKKGQNRKRKSVQPAPITTKRVRASTSNRRCSNSTVDSELTLPSHSRVHTIPAVRTPIVETGHQAPYDFDLLNLYPADTAYDVLF